MPKRLLKKTMTEEVKTLVEMLTSGPVLGALATALFGALAYIWKLHTTATTNKTKLEEHVKLALERDDHLNTKVAAVDSKVEKVDKNLDKLTDKMDGLVDAHHRTHDILVAHVAHEEIQEKNIERLAKKINNIEDSVQG